MSKGDQLFASTVDPTAPLESAAQFLFDASIEYAYPAALRAVTLLDIADQLVDGPKTAEALAQATQTNSQKLYRILRLVASRGVFREDDKGRFELTAAANLLRTDVPLSARHAVLMLTDKSFWLSNGMLVEGLRADSVSFEKIFGAPFFEHWSQDIPPEENFHVGMAAMSELESKYLLHSYKFPEGATVADIGGGYGGLLLHVLEENPSLNGILFDQEHVLAKNLLGKLGDESRWQTASGDFFQKVPKADIYMMKYIMHDWGNEEAVRILRNCRKAMTPGGRVLVFDSVVPPGNTPHSGKYMDMIVISIYSAGGERTEMDFRQLFTEAGLQLNRVINTGKYLSILEAVAV